MPPFVFIYLLPSYSSQSIFVRWPVFPWTPFFPVDGFELMKVIDVENKPLTDAKQQGQQGGGWRINEATRRWLKNQRCNKAVGKNQKQKNGLVPRSHVVFQHIYNKHFNQKDNYLSCRKMVSVQRCWNVCTCCFSLVTLENDLQLRICHPQTSTSATHTHTHRHTTCASHRLSVWTCCAPLSWSWTGELSPEKWPNI